MKLVMLLVVMFCHPSFADDPEAARGRLVQEILPALEHRQASASMRIDSAEMYFAGEGSLGEAWPELSGRPLWSEGFIRGKLIELADREEDRADQWTQSPDADLSQPDQRRWRSALDEALKAEFEADGLTRRLLQGIAFGLSEAPGISDESIAPQLERWRVLRALPDPFDETNPAHLDAAAIALQSGELEDSLVRYRHMARRAVTVPGDIGLRRLVSADIGRTSRRMPSGVTRDATVARLSMVLPLLSDDLRLNAQEMIDALETETLTQEASRLQAAIDAVTDRLENPYEEPATSEQLEAAEVVATQKLNQVKSDRDRVRVGLTQTPRDKALEETLGLRVALAEQELALATRNRQATPDTSLSTEEGARRTQAQVDDAQRRAEQTRRQAQLAGRAELETMMARVTALSARISEKEKARLAGTALSTRNYRKEQRDNQAEIDGLDSTTPSMRMPQTQEAYVNQLLWIERLRAELRSRRVQAVVASELNTALEKTPQLLSDTEDVPVPDITPDQLDAALTVATHQILSAMSSQDRLERVDGEEELSQAVYETVDVIVEAARLRHLQRVREQDEVARLLWEARGDLRRVRSELSRSVRDELLVEAIRRSEGSSEDAVFDPVLSALGAISDVPYILAERTHSSEKWSVSKILGDAQIFIVRLFYVLLVLFGWRATVRRGPAWVEVAVKTLQTSSPRSVISQQHQLIGTWLEGDIQSHVERIVATIPTASNLTAALFVHWIISGEYPLIGLFTLAWLVSAAWALIPGATGVVMGSSATDHSPKSTYGLALQTAYLVTACALVILVMKYVLLSVIRADLLCEWVSSATMVVCVCVVAAELLRWLVVIQASVQRLGQQSKVIGWATQQRGFVLTRLLQAAAGVAILVMAQLGRVMSVLVDSKGGLGWIGSLIARYALKEVDDTRTPISRTDRDRIVSKQGQEFLHTHEVDSIGSIFEAWKEQRRCELVSVIGEKGSGKSLILQEVVNLGGKEMKSHLFRPPSQLNDPEEALTWLAGCLGLTHKPGSSWMTLADELNQQPPSVLIMDDTHRLLLRRVGGFSALRRVLNVMHATAKNHFWVAGFHAPMWSFLEGTAVPVNLEVFRHQIRIAGLSRDRLSNWIGQTMLDAGVDFDFDNLAAGSVFNTEPKGQAERIATAFWRRLCDISLGNPEIAMVYWLDSLRYPPPDIEADGGGISHTSGTKAVDVALFMPPPASTLESLPDIDLFVLSSVVIHGGLDVELLSESLNMSRGLVRATCRHLETVGVLDINDGQYAVCLPWRPVVARVLRQKHFLHQR